MRTPMGKEAVIAIGRRITNKYGEYQAGSITYGEFMNYVNALGSTPLGFRTIKKWMASGQFSKQFGPASLSDPAYGLGDAYDDEMIILEKQIKLIEEHVRAGKMGLDEANRRLDEITARKQAAWDNLSFYLKPYHAVKDAVWNRMQEAKSFVKGAAKFAGKQVDKVTDTAKKAADTAIDFGKDVGKAATNLLDIGGMIIPVVIIGGGFLIYKLVTSDTGKTLAAGAARRL